MQLDVLLDKVLVYAIYKNALTDSLPNETGKTFQSFLEMMNIPESSLAEQSNVVYIDILDEYTDNKDTIIIRVAGETSDWDKIKLSGSCW